MEEWQIEKTSLPEGKKRRYKESLEQGFYFLNKEKDETIIILDKDKKIYKIRIQKMMRRLYKLRCNCKDGRGVCKHICYVVNKIGRLEEQKKLDYLYTDLMSEESSKEINKNTTRLKTILELGEEEQNIEEVNWQVYKQYKRKKREIIKEKKKEQKAIVKDEICGICYNKLMQSQENVSQEQEGFKILSQQSQEEIKGYLRQCVNCKNYIHNMCIGEWLKKEDKCIFCRNQWESIQQRISLEQMQ